MNTRLRILCEQEYIGRRYDSSYKLQAKFAEYYLLPKGIDVLKQHPEYFKPGVLRNLKRDVDASDRFARHSINIFDVYARLRESYGSSAGSSLRFYTKSYMVGERTEGFPKPLPDAFVSIKDTENKLMGHHIVECFDDTMPQSAMRKRIGQLISHADGDEWTLTKTYPTILIICGTDRLQKNAQRWVDKALDEAWSDRLTIRIATLDTLQHIGEIQAKDL